MAQLSQLSLSKQSMYIIYSDSVSRCTADWGPHGPAGSLHRCGKHLGHQSTAKHKGRASITRCGQRVQRHSKPFSRNARTHLLEILSLMRFGTFLMPFDQSSLFSLTSMRTSLVRIIFAANFFTSFTALGALRLNLIPCNLLFRLIVHSRVTWSLVCFTILPNAANQENNVKGM
jgi:hypothetical protein